MWSSCCQPTVTPRAGEVMDGDWDGRAAQSYGSYYFRQGESQETPVEANPCSAGCVNTLHGLGNKELMPLTTPPCLWQPPRPQQTAFMEKCQTEKAVFPPWELKHPCFHSYGEMLPHSTQFSASSHLEWIALGTALREGGDVCDLQCLDPIEEASASSSVFTIEYEYRK